MEEGGIPCLWQGGFPDTFSLKNIITGPEHRVPDFHAHIFIIGFLRVCRPGFIPCGTRILLLLRYRDSLSFSDYYCPLFSRIQQLVH